MRPALTLSEQAALIRHEQRELVLPEVARLVTQLRGAPGEGVRVLETFKTLSPKNPNLVTQLCEAPGNGPPNGSTIIIILKIIRQQGTIRHKA